MPVRILTVHYDPARGLFEDEVVAEFIQNKRIIEMTPQFFMLNGKPHWTLYINYEVDLPEVIKNADGLSHEEQLLLKRLTEWRKETADEINLPPFIIASNKQLVSIVKLKPQTNESLKMVHGFGSKKVQKYGKSITDIIRSFFVNAGSISSHSQGEQTRKQRKPKTKKIVQTEQTGQKENPSPDETAPDATVPDKTAPQKPESESLTKSDKTLEKAPKKDTEK